MVDNIPIVARSLLDFDNSVCIQIFLVDRYQSIQATVVFLWIDILHNNRGRIFSASNNYVAVCLVQCFIKLINAGREGLTVEIPFDKVNAGNLMKLLDAKGDLIKKALGISDIRIEMKEDRVTFPWFTEVEPDSAMAYTNFIAALCRMSKEAKRVTATAKEVENEKYAFRCFLLRLGFIDAEYKKDRKILLQKRG